MASFEQWLEAFQEAYAAPDRASGFPCPNCGAQELRLRFVLYGDRGRTVNAVFWCDHCLEGMPPGPSELPVGSTPVRSDAANIPNYRIVPPTSYDEDAAAL